MRSYTAEDEETPEQVLRRLPTSVVKRMRYDAQTYGARYFQRARDPELSDADRAGMLELADYEREDFYRFQQELQRGVHLGLRGTGRQVQEPNILAICPPGHVLTQPVVGEAKGRGRKQFIAVAVGGEGSRLT